MKKFLLACTIMAVSSFALFGCAEEEEPAMDEPAVEETEDEPEMEPEMEEEVEEEPAAEDDIVDIATSDENFSTLVAALQEAELVDTLKGEGPFTVFAPTNEAFDNLLADLGITAEELLAQPDLAKVLTYHVVPAKVMSTDLTDGSTAETVNGQEIMIDLSDGVMINESTVTTADIEATNGVVHVIDKVLVPDDFQLQ